MKEELYDKINHIENLKDRALLKELLNEVFISLYEHSEDMYHSLEKRVFEEIEYNQQNYSLYTTIVKKNDFDPIHYFLYPMLEEDVEEKEYDLNQILENMLTNKQVDMFKVFFKCDYLIFKDILKKDLQFRGTIKTDKRVYDAFFKIKENAKYWDEVYRLYRMFIKNNIPWRTINAPYISRIVDVVLVKYEKGITKDEVIEEIHVDFGQYSQYIEYDMVPVWNIQKLVLESTGFPMPCEDTVHFEHNVSLKGEGLEHGYLVEYDYEDIKHIKHTKDSLIIISKMEEAKDWGIFKVVKPKESKIEKYSFELVSNSKKISFAEKLSNQNGMNIKTKAELIRMINSLETSKHLQFKDIQIVHKKDSVKEETYNMNDFIIDEIRDGEYGKTMILYFNPKDENYFIIRDLLSFIVSEIQLFYPEYKCEGRLI
ncbi:normocyte-binding protein [Anaerophilus nitritogenes]|uniref:normocyte-binding protein n=1 Tax=Anaerophilus nitritogenes TaxID=2498136 RepID=UPI0013EC4AA9|nr:normocyte-binding protein [Anaerophilus nitritogenes]